MLAGAVHPTRVLGERWRNVIRRQASGLRSSNKENSGASDRERGGAAEEEETAGPSLPSNGSASSTNPGPDDIELSNLGSGGSTRSSQTSSHSYSVGGYVTYLGVRCRGQHVNPNGSLELRFGGKAKGGAVHDVP